MVPVLVGVFDADNNLNPSNKEELWENVQIQDHIIRQVVEGNRMVWFFDVQKIRVKVRM
jgi:hypothetical protein